MKNLFYNLVIIGLFCVFHFSLNGQNVGINSTGISPDNSAMLDITSSDKGLLIPRMDSTSRKNILTPATGLMVFDSTCNRFYYHNGAAWVVLIDGLHHEIRDADNDTKITVEKTADEDSIRFDIMGIERLVLKQNANGKTMMSLPNNNNDIHLGENAGLNSSAYNNVFIGKDAGLSNTNGNSSVMIGNKSGYYNSIGGSQIFIGSAAGRLNTTGDLNVSIGTAAGQLSNGSFNTFIGNYAGPNTTPTTNGNNNTVLGAYAGHQIKGSGNVFLGRLAGYYELGSDKLYIENSALGTPLIYGDFADDTVKIYGTLGVKDEYHFPIADGSNGQVLKTDGSGQIAWQNESTSTIIADGDNDTKIQVEESSDDDIIRLDVEGTEVLQISMDSLQINGKLTAVSASARPLLIQHNTAGNGAYLEVNNASGTRALFGVDGNGFSGGDTTDVSIANWSNGDLVLHTNATEQMRISAAGKVGVGRTAVTNILEIDGQASKTTAGSWVANSDARLKKNITSLSSEKMLSNLLALKGVTYEWNDTITGNNRPERIQFGFTAQNIQEVFPTLVEEDNLGYLQTAYGTYDAMIVEAIRGLNDKIEKQAHKIDSLKKENEALKAQAVRIDHLESMVEKLAASLN